TQTKSSFRIAPVQQPTSPMTGTIVGLKAPLCSFARVLPALATTLLLLSIAPLHAEAISDDSNGITVIVEASGHYSIRRADPNWVFTGTLPGSLSALKTVEGHDGIGDYHEI